MLDALSKHQVSLVDINGEYRKTYDIIKDIAGVWDQLTSMEQAAVIEALAGTRQQNIFTSLVTQFREAENAMDAMANSAGALEESYDIRLSSIQAHVNQLKVAFDQLSMDVVESDFAKGVVDTVSKIVIAIDTVIEKVGVLGTILGTIAAIELLRNLPAIISTIVALATGFVNLSGAATVLSGGLVGLTGTLVGLGSVLGQVAIAASVITLIVLAFKGIRDAYREAHPTFDMLKDDAEKAQNAVRELQQEIDTNNQRIQELTQLKTDGAITEFQVQELENLEAENEKLREQLELRKQIAEYKAGIVAEEIGEQNRQNARAFFNAEERELDIYDELTGMQLPGTTRNTEGLGGLLNTIDDYKAAEKE